ncbi:HD domain-containing phosphohydrolase [Fusibacter bizertensis]
MTDSETQSLSIDLKEAYDIINQSNLVIFKWTLSEEIPTDFVSDSISIFGYEPKDFYTGELKDYWEFVYAEDRERVKSELYHARMHGKSNYHNQYRVICKTGEIRWVEEWVLHERSNNGNLINEKGIIRDITESVIVSEKLKESEARYKELFENASALIFTFDSKGILTTYNHSFADMLSLPYNRKGMVIDDYLSLDTKTQLKGKRFFEYCLAQIDSRVEVKFVDSKGTEIYVELNNRIIYHHGKLSELQSVGNDVSDKKMAEEKIRYLTEHDPLTGLNNRLFFDEKLSELEKNDEKNVCIIMGDVNGLKMVNDAFGHKTGDQMLAAIAKVLKEIFTSPTDTISRLSGDEFAIITHAHDISKLIDEIQAACQKLTQFPFVVDISLGYAVRKKVTQSLDSVFREADHLMYRNKLRRSKRIKLGMIDSLKNQLEVKSVETSRHSQRMGKIAQGFGNFIKLNDALMEELLLAVSVHDIGMVSVDKKIIDKKGNLSMAEYKEVMKHSEIGYHLLIATPSLAGVGEDVLSHHENYDGSGYPQGLKALEIPYISRIIAVIDSFETLTGNKSYRTAINSEEALVELMHYRGIKYDPVILDDFVAYIRYAEKNKGNGN